MRSRKQTAVWACCIALLLAASIATDAHWPDYPAFSESATCSPANETQRLRLPPNLPDRFDVVVRLDDATHVLRLMRHSLRAPGFRARAYVAGGHTIEVQPDPPATYRGWVVDRPLWPVVADLRSEGLNARITTESGSAWSIRPLAGEDRSSGDALHDFGRERPEWSAPNLDASPLEHPPGRAAAAAVDTDSSYHHAGQHVAEIALDLTNAFYTAHGSTTPGAVAAAESILNEVDYVFARDAMITYAITDIIVRATPFYSGSMSTLWSEFVHEWGTNQTHIHRDVAHLLEEGGPPRGVGIRGTICDISSAYSYSAGGPPIMAHELTHNWGSYHCHEYWPCSTTCASCMSLGLRTRDVVLAFRDTLTCLDEGGAHGTPLPPFAEPDFVDLGREELVAGNTRTFDVLANDYDGNLDPLSIEDFEPVSRCGAAVTLSAGTGSGGRDELLYTMPEQIFPGNDQFHYGVGDGTGHRTQGTATLRVAAPGLIGYWPLDGSGQDASGDVRNASTGAAAWIPGVYGQAAELDGVDDYMQVTGFGMLFPAVSLVAWVRRDGDQSAYAGIVVGNGLNTEAGLTFGDVNELRYHWNGDPAASGWDPGIVVPDGQWVLVGLAVDTDQATIYMHDGSTLHSAAHTNDHAMLDFDDQIYFGHGGWETPFFKGAIDDVRIYDHALTPAQFLALHDLGGRAFAPSPPDGGRTPRGPCELTWSAGLGALSHDVYFGTGYLSVHNATPLSPEFLGNTTSSAMPAPPPLIGGRTYAWRVDEVTAGGTVKGDVWLFSVETLLARWPLDELSGDIAIASEGALDGTYLGSPGLGMVGARPELDRSVYLDGLDDTVELPALHLDRNDVSFSMWVRRDGTQTSGAGLLVTHSETTYAGLNVSVSGSLQYRWNLYGTIFEPDFDFTGIRLPDGEWALVVLVIAPDRTTVYAGRQGTVTRFDELDSANGPEAFDGPLYVGQDPTDGLFFRGFVDDLRIHDHVLSPAEVTALYAVGVGAGRVPDGADQPGAPLRVDRLSEEEVQITWSPSCLASDPDYAIYEGEIGAFGGHLPTICSTGGAHSASVHPQSGDRYFLVVPISRNREGSYGTDASGRPRESSEGACHLQYAVDCD